MATPHYLHADVGVAALEHGLHTLVEKPMAANKEGCERLLAAHEASGRELSIMLSMRTKPVYRKVKQLLERGELGEIRRVHWTASNWFRTEAYYASLPWRGTWKGEGGGVLLNQCPHQLDLFCWFFGLPRSVTAFCEFGLGNHHHPYCSGLVGPFVKFGADVCPMLLKVPGALLHAHLVHSGRSVVGFYRQPRRPWAYQEKQVQVVIKESKMRG